MNPCPAPALPGGLPPMLRQRTTALPLRLSSRIGGLLLCASCSQDVTPPQSVEPAQRPAVLPVVGIETAQDLEAPFAVDRREVSETQPTTPEPPAEDTLISKSVATRVRELQASVGVYRKLPLEDRTEHLRRIYEHELLELGQTLASIRRDDGGLDSYFASQAVSTFEELAFESGEDSDMGVRAYQSLADLKRDLGLLDEAEDYEEALQRLLDERDD